MQSTHLSQCSVYENLGNKYKIYNEKKIPQISTLQYFALHIKWCHGCYCSEFTCLKANKNPAYCDHKYT